MTQSSTVLSKSWGHSTRRRFTSNLNACLSISFAFIAETSLDLNLSHSVACSAIFPFYHFSFLIICFAHINVSPANMASGISSDFEYEGVEMSTTPVPIDPDSVTTSSLHALQSADQRKVMDIVDKLRRTGLSGIVELPQLVVCGDQSSGKSSVLEAITEIPFPRKENLCTRFATEVSKFSNTPGIMLTRSRLSSVVLHRPPAQSRSLQTSFVQSRSKPSSSRSASL